MELNKEQIAIIEHTIKNGSFCGSSPDMDAICEAGYMICIGRKSFVPDPYYQVTTEGRHAVNKATAV